MLFVIKGLLKGLSPLVYFAILLMVSLEGLISKSPNTQVLRLHVSLW
jgi:hypothetical protein